MEFKSVTQNRAAWLNKANGKKFKTIKKFAEVLGITPRKANALLNETSSMNAKDARHFETVLKLKPYQMDQPCKTSSSEAMTSSNSDEYYTPGELMALVRTFMGGIELDPASNAYANEHFVQADRYFDKSNDGLNQEWIAKNVWLNPPFSNASIFVAKLSFDYLLGNFNEALLLINYRSDSAWCQKLQASGVPFLNLAGRVQFERPIDVVNERRNSTCNSLIYLGSREADFIQWAKDHDLGVVMKCVGIE